MCVIKIAGRGTCSSAIVSSSIRGRLGSLLVCRGLAWLCETSRKAETKNNRPPRFNENKKLQEVGKKVNLCRKAPFLVEGAAGLEALKDGLAGVFRRICPGTLKNAITSTKTRAFGLKKFDSLQHAKQTVLNTEKALHNTQAKQRLAPLAAWRSRSRTCRPRSPSPPTYPRAP